MNLDSVLGSFEARVALRLPDGSEHVYQPRCLDDLRPEHLFRSLPEFESLSRVRERLAAPGSGPDALEAAERWLAERGAPLLAKDTGSSKPEADLDALGRLLGRPAASAQTAEPEPSGALGAILERAVKPHVVADTATRRSELLRELDRIASGWMRDILCSEGFRALESSWRGAARVVSELDSDEDLQISLFDLGPADLARALDTASDLENSEVHSALVESGSGYTLIAVDAAFGSDERELTALAALGAVTARAGGALIADARPSLFGCDSLEQCSDPRSWNTETSVLWQALRTSPLASHIGLVFPRVALRTPYGARRDRVEDFEFEELPQAGGLHRDQRLWGSGAFAVAELIGKSFRDSGWEGYLDELEPELSDLPADVYDDEGEQRLVPVTNIAIAERRVEAYLGAGVMPLLAHADRAALRLPRLCSIADPPTTLAGLK